MKFLFLPLILLQLVNAFTNPIIPGFNPDPSIQRLGNDYFLVTSTFEYFPGIPLYHSKDLIKWELIGHVLNRPSQLNLRGTAPSGGIFAPTLRYNEWEKMWYCIGTVFDVINPPDVTHIPRSFFVKTADIFDETSWSDPVYVDQPGFDPDLFFDPVTHKTYFTSTMGSQFVDASSGYFAIWLTEIDLKTGTSLADSKLLHISSLPLSAPRLAEGSHIYYINKTYYLLTAEAGTEAGSHRAMISRAPSINGPWESNPSNPILWNGRNTSNPVLATGHADLVNSPDGKWWAVFLGTRPQSPESIQGRAQLGRETFLAPVAWKDGWPVVNGGDFITEKAMPGLYDLKRPKKWREEFHGGKLGDKAWYTPRTPYKPFHSLEETLKGKGLTLWGNVYNLTHRETPATLMRKQVDLETVWSTELDFTPKSPRHEAGATIFLSIHYHNTISVTQHPDSGERVVKAVTRSSTLAAANITYHAIPKSGSVILFIKAERDQYSLGYSMGEKPKYVASVESKWLQAWLAGWQCFTGAFFGVYASGNGLPMPGVSARFGWVQTELL